MGYWVVNLTSHPLKRASDDRSPRSLARGAHVCARCGRARGRREDLWLTAVCLEASGVTELLRGWGQG